MQPVRDLVLLNVDEKPEKSESGLYMPKESWETPPNTGEVASTGVLVENFEVGQRVIFNPYAVMQIKDGVKSYFLIKEKDILGTL